VIDRNVRIILVLFFSVVAVLSMGAVACNFLPEKGQAITAILSLTVTGLITPLLAVKMGESGTTWIDLVNEIRTVGSAILEGLIL